MEWFKDFDWRSLTVPKVAGVVVLGIVVLTIAVWVLGFGFRMAFTGGTKGVSQDFFGGSSGAGYPFNAPSGIGLSERNVSDSVKPGTPVPGKDSGNYESTQFMATFQTGNLNKLCSDIEELKPLPYVVFENSNKADRNCSYTFKVETNKASEVRANLEALGPKTFVENVQTIKNVVNDYTNQEQILENKISAIEKTLTDAQFAYDQVKNLATQSKDAGTLAKVIDSKLALIEKLTTERLNVGAQLDSIKRAKALELDRVKYTYFNVYAYETLIVNWQSIKDVWISELQQFVREVNDVAKGLTLGVLTVALRALQVAVYLVIVLFIVKYGFRAGKVLWKA